MAAEPILHAETWGRTASAAAPGRLRGAFLRRSPGATTAAVVFSALLHGALAATVLMWPDAPVPLVVGEPIVVALVTMAPTAGRPTETAAGALAETAGAATAVNEAPASSPATVAGSAVPLAIQGEPPEPVLQQDDTLVKDLAIETASGDDIPASPIAPISPAAIALPSRVTIPPPISRPPRRPVIIAHAEPKAGPPPRSAPRSEQAIASPPTADAPSTPPGAGEKVIETAAVPRAHSNPTTAAGNGGSPSDPTQAAAIGAPMIGPRFAMGTALNPRPRYPLSARRRGLEGRVIVRVFVEADGRARSADIIQSSQYAILDVAAVEALQRWRFDPARQSGLPVASWVDIPVTFRLRD